ncbi:MAG: hypothetical protein ACC661_03665 [Verrucomicrobiales bacterium]
MRKIRVLFIEKVGEGAAALRQGAAGRWPLPAPGGNTKYGEEETEQETLQQGWGAWTWTRDPPED